MSIDIWVLFRPEARPAWPEGMGEIRKGAYDKAPAGGL